MICAPTTGAVPCVGADSIRPSFQDQPLRLVAPGALFSFSLPGFLWIAQPAAAAGKRGQSAALPAPDARDTHPRSVPRNGVRGQATGVLALLGASPRGSLVLSILGKNITGEFRYPGGRIRCAPTRVRRIGAHERRGGLAARKGRVEKRVQYSIFEISRNI